MVWARSSGDAVPRADRRGGTGRPLVEDVGEVRGEVHPALALDADAARAVVPVPRVPGDVRLRGRTAPRAVGGADDVVRGHFPARVAEDGQGAGTGLLRDVENHVVEAVARGAVRRGAVAGVRRLPFGARVVDGLRARAGPPSGEQRVRGGGERGARRDPPPAGKKRSCSFDADRLSVGPGFPVVLGGFPAASSGTGASPVRPGRVCGGAGFAGEVAGSARRTVSSAVRRPSRAVARAHRGTSRARAATPCGAWPRRCSWCRRRWPGGTRRPGSRTGRRPAR